MILFAKRDNLRLNRLFESPVHATLIVRPGGFSAEEELFLAHKLLGEKCKFNLIKMKDSEGKSLLSVGDVRQLSVSLNLSSKKGGERRLVLVPEDVRMDPRAQNALLKILEEPPEGVYFVLLSNREGTFLPTISSRCSLIKLEKPNEIDVVTSISQNLKLKEDQARVLWMQAGKSSRELARITGDDSLKEASLESLSDAKKFLGSKDYDKLVSLKNRFSKREDALNFLDALLVVLEIFIEKNPKDALKFKLLVDRVESAHSAVRANANLRIQLMSLV